MECSSSNTYAPPRQVVGNFVSAPDPIQGMPGILGSTDDDPRQNQRENTARGGHILIVMRDERMISYSCSDVKYVLELPDAVLWMNPKLFSSSARRPAPYEATTTPMASDPYFGENLANTGTHVERTALVSGPNPAIDDVDIEQSGGLIEKEWPSQSSHWRPAPPTHHEIIGSFQDRKERSSRSPVTSLIHENPSWNRMGPEETVQPFSTDQFSNVDGNYNQHRRNPFNDAKIQISSVPAIRINASDTALAHANTFSPLTLYGSAGPRGPGSAGVMPETVAQAPHPGGDPMQANLGLQQGGSPMCHEMDHPEALHDTLSWPEAPTPEITIGSSAAYPDQEPAMPDKQQANAGSPYEPPQLHPDLVQLVSNPMGQPRRGPKAPQSAAQKAMKPGKPRGRRTKPLNAAQKEHAKLVRKAGRKACDCGQRKVKCKHVVESPHSPGTQDPGKLLAATHAQRETAVCGEPDTPSSQNTWLTENTPVSPFSPSRNQSFENTADFNMSPTNLFTEDFQPFNDNDDAEGEVDDEEMLDMDNTRRQLFH